MTTKFGFIIPSCLHTQRHVETLDKCIMSINQYHPDAKIVIILDHTSKFDITGKYKNTIVEKDVPKVPADMLTYFFYHKNRYFPYAIILQDSIELIKAFDISKVDDVEYLWHFTNHRVQWSTIKEPRTMYNIDNNISTHNDLLEHCFVKYIKDDCFRQYCHELNQDKSRWSGCFACATIISIDFLDILQYKTNIIDIMSNMSSNRDRRAIESIFALACQYSTGREIHSSYGGLYFDGSYSCDMKCHTWHKIVHNRSNHGSKFHKNIVLVTSVCYVQNTPYTYTNTRSIFNSSERFDQLKETLESIKSKIPDSYIFLVEYSPFNKEENEYLNSHCDFIHNLFGEDLDSEIFGKYKALGERVMTLRALEIIYQQFVFENIYKISGRYKYSEKFDYSLYNNDKMNFYPIHGDVNNINTCGYKLPNKYLSGFINYLDNTRQDAIDKYSGSYERYISSFVQKNINEVNLLTTLGITGKVSVCGSVYDR